jgi:hypothetical protein
VTRCNGPGLELRNQAALFFLSKIPGFPEAGSAAAPLGPLCHSTGKWVGGVARLFRLKNHPDQKHEPDPNGKFPEGVLYHVYIENKINAVGWIVKTWVLLPYDTLRCLRVIHTVLPVLPFPGTLDLPVTLALHFGFALR